jgi:hypothetical protein
MVLSLATRSHMRRESSNKIKCNIQNSVVLQHTKTTLHSPSKFLDFTVTTFDSCGIETISQEFCFNHQTQFNICIQKQCSQRPILDMSGLLGTLQLIQANQTAQRKFLYSEESNKNKPSNKTSHQCE